MDSSVPTTNSPDSSSSSSSGQDGPSPDSDGLRFRGGLPPYSAPGLPQWPGGPQVPLQGGLPENMPPHPMYMPMQMLWWQQMYARHYYMQYQAAVAASQSPSPSAPSASPPPPQPEPAVQPPLGPNPLPENPPAVNPNLQVNPNIQMNAQGGAVLNDDELNRDWLDWLYTVSRAGVLLSIVYFYSSFSRFVMVLGAMLLVYLHQAGWFPFRAEQQPVRREQGAAAQEEADPQQDMQEMERLMDEGLDDDTEEARPADAAAAAPDPGFLTTAWAFVSTFFTSLIPEGRANPA
uniref:HERPUD family member 2 n=1 Tax=Neogobius melanostomus TaxID=47308 RepID=A0A8C6UFA1_9GOBI